MTHFKIVSVTGGTLYQHDGTTLVAEGAFITAADGAAGLRFLPSPGSTTTGQVTVRASVAPADSGVAGDPVTASIAVTPTGTFSDDPLVPGVTSVRLVHLIELQQRSNAQRVRFGLAPVTYAAQEAFVSVITAQQISQIRTAVVQAYVQAGKLPPAFTDPVLTPGSFIKAAHIQELREAIKTLEAAP